MDCLNCGHPESDHETLEYREGKSRRCVRHLLGKDRCSCSGFRDEPTELEIARATFRQAVVTLHEQRCRAEAAEDAIRQVRVLAKEMQTAPVEDDSLAYYADMIDRATRKIIPNG